MTIVGRTPRNSIVSPLTQQHHEQLHGCNDDHTRHALLMQLA
jgi:hypothetical protein